MYVPAVRNIGHSSASGTGAAGAFLSLFFFFLFFSNSIRLHGTGTARLPGGVLGRSFQGLDPSAPPPPGFFSVLLPSTTLRVFVLGISSLGREGRGR